MRLELDGDDECSGSGMWSRGSILQTKMLVTPAAPYSSSATPVITPSWLSFRLRSSTTPPMGLSSKSPTPSYSQPSQSSETAVVIAGIVGIEVKKNDNGDL
ncbi:hypothetical protein Bca4012_088183 [Brassica carinata]